MKNFFILLLIIFVMTGCVSLKDYRQVKARMIRLEYEKVEAGKQNNQIKNSDDTLQQNIAQTER